MNLPDPVIQAAEEAANAGDYEAAERLLREVVAEQEANLGPLHPELASTLNNLAMVCERTNKIAEAESGYRRAHAIAVASLPPGHPFIATSLKNLLDFCATHGIPVWAPPAVKLDVGTSSPGSAPDPQPELAFTPEAQIEPTSPKSGITPRVIATASLIAGTLVAVLFIMYWRESSDSSRPSTQAEETSPPNGSSSPSSTPVPTRQPEVEPTPETSDRPSVPAASPPSPTPSAPAAAVTVLNAQLCSALERQGSPDWQCTIVSGAHQPATFAFYTRLQTDSDTTVEHLWYQGDRLHQRMRLRVRANPGTGFRTYSSNTVSPERAGDWKVELRAEDGTLLREERFVVR